MKSPLAEYKKIVKELELGDVEVTPMQKVGFLEAQKQEIQAALWRAEVDMLHAMRLQDSENQVLRAKGNNNYADHRNQVEQFSGAIRFLDKFIAELRTEYKLDAETE